MKRIAANLTPLLACPAFWLWHVLGAVLCVPAFVYAWSPNDPDAGAWVAALTLPFWSAFVLTSLQRDLLVAPVSFCLPGHRDVLRRTSFLVGIATCLTASLPILSYRGLDGLSLLGAIWSAFCFGLIVYLLIAAFLFLLDSAITALAPAMAVGFVLVQFPSTRHVVERVALFAPGWNTAVLAVLAVLVWRRIGSVALARRTCGSRFLSLQMALRRSAAEEVGESRKREFLSKHTWGVRYWLLQKCFARIGRRPMLSFRRHLAITNYELAGCLVPLSPWVVPIVVLSALVLIIVGGYDPLGESQADAPKANGVYALSCLLAMYLGVPMFTTMLLPVGRRERFWSAVTISLSNGVLVLVASLLSYVLLLGVGWVAPALPIGGNVHSFRPADFVPAFVPLLVLPTSLMLKLVCKKWLLIPEILLFLAAAIVLVNVGSALREMGLFPIIVIVSVSWVILVRVLYIYSFHRDLVRE